MRLLWRACVLLVVAAACAVATPSADADTSADGTIAGTVTAATNGAPVRGVLVSLEDPTSGATENATCTDASGSYSLSASDPTDSYLVQFSDGGCSEGVASNASGFAAQYYPGATSASGASAVTVMPGMTVSGIDGALMTDPASSDGVIAGTLTDRDTGQPAPGVAVQVVSTATTAMSLPDSPTDPSATMTVGVPTTTQSGCTGASGSYAIGSLPAGTYTVTFDEDPDLTCGGGAFIPQFYDGIDAPLTENGPQQGLDNAPTVAVAAGAATPGINGALAPAAQISGTVTDAGTGQPAAKTLVQVFDAAGDPVGYACTQADGTYTTSLLPSGTYRVGFATDSSLYIVCLVRADTYLPAYYGARATQSTLASATQVAISAPADVSGIDGRVVRGATITGTVTLPDHTVSEGLNGPGEIADVLDTAGRVVASAYVFQDGIYAVGGLLPGRYIVRFSAEGYETQYYSGTPVQGAATPVPLAEGATASGIGAVMVPDHLLGSLSGTVTDTTTRLPIPGVVVGVSRPGDPLEGVATTAADGTYTVSGIPAGAYDVEFIDPLGRHLPEFSIESASAAHATKVAVTGGGTSTGVDAAMVKQAAAPAALVSPPVISVSPTGSISITLACPGTLTCAGQVGLSAPSFAHAVRSAAERSTGVTPQRFSVRTGHVAAVRFTLSAATRALLKRAHRASAVVSLREGTRTVRYTVTIAQQGPRAAPTAGAQLGLSGRP